MDLFGISWLKSCRGSLLRGRPCWARFAGELSVLPRKLPPPRRLSFSPRRAEIAGAGGRQEVSGWVQMFVLCLMGRWTCADSTSAYVPLDDTPAPISMSGSSITRPVASGFPPVPPYSADDTHFKSASVRRSMGMTLTPVE